MNKIDWKRKLTSRKLWAAVTGFVSMLLLALGKDAGVVQTVTATIMAGASLIAYIIGEGLADSGNVTTGDTLNSYYNFPEDNGNPEPQDTEKDFGVNEKEG